MQQHHHSNWQDRIIRAAIIALLAATCVRVWLGPVTWTSAAYAQIPDAGKQRRELVVELQRTNQLLEKVLKTLQSHTLKVEIVSTDKTNVPGRSGAPPTNP